ncbi:MAG: type II toxin-antitoxin system HicA family toxin [Candidatus Kapabacteria bacterium]|nr:type II toxin-antitoxin system HicA family toxin [Candidatus Kapabacteria bacterium]
MKRNELLKILRRNGCYLKREGSNHSLWISSINGVVEAIPRHTEIPDLLAKKIIKNLISK